MASTMVIKVRYFGTPKVKVGDRVRHLKAPIDENGQLGFDMGGLRKRICSSCYLPTGADISLVYIDEDGDVVTLVDDDDLRDAMRQRLKSFRIDVLMNDDKAYAKSSSQSTQVLIDSVDTTSSATHNYDDRSSHFLNECPIVADYLVNPTVACFKWNHSEAIAHRWYDSAPLPVSYDDVCGCSPITGSRFKSIV